MEEKIYSLARVFHQKWRETRLTEDGNYCPRIKKTTDDSYIEYANTDEVDIANTDFDDLPYDWKEENLLAAEVVILFLSENPEFDILNKEHYLKAGDYVHSRWLQRNSWAKEGPLDVEFEKLSLDEQEKDITQVKLGLKIC